MFLTPKMTSVDKDGEIILLYYWWKVKSCGNNLEALQKLNIESPYDLALVDTYITAEHRDMHRDVNSKFIHNKQR